MAQNWPAIRTTPTPFNITQVWAAIPAAVLTLILVPLTAYLYLLAIGAFTHSLTDTLQMSNTTLFAQLLLTSPVLAWVGMIVAVLASFWAARKGYAGWACALSFGALSGALFGAILALDDRAFSVASFLIGAFAATGLIYAVTYWLLFRLFYPKAFRTPN